MLSTAATVRAPMRIATSSRLTSTLKNQHALRQLPLSQTKHFSTRPLRLQQQQSKQSPQPSKPSPPNDGQPEVPTFSLDGLGISPGLKKVIIGVICILGTVETYTYYIWIKNRWFPDEKDGEEAAHN